jgi:DNA-binding transcriptional MerR regulator
MDEIGTDLIGIGEFARLSRLSPKALRRYDELGLLRPARVDAHNGYRWYAPDQAARARLIALLRRVDLPLARITDLIDAEPAEAAALLRADWARAVAGFAARADLVEFLVHRLTGERHPMFDVTVREIPARSLLTAQRHVTLGEITAFTTELVQRVGGRTPGLPGIEGAPFLIYYGEVSADSDGPVEWCRPVPDDDAAAVAGRFGMTLRVESAHREAYVRLTAGQTDGTHGELAAEALERWCVEHGERPAGAPRQIFFADLRTAAPGDPACDVAAPLR